MNGNNRTDNRSTIDGLLEPDVDPVFQIPDIGMIKVFDRYNRPMMAEQTTEVPPE